MPDQFSSHEDWNPADERPFAFNKGVEDRKAGRRFDENPFDLPVNRRVWEDGWCDQDMIEMLGA